LCANMTSARCITLSFTMSLNVYYT
jgi:hypothetical protein